MCNVNVIFKGKKSTNEDSMKITALLQSASAHSFIVNDDGDGAYFDTGVLAKSKNKMNYVQYMKDIRDSNVILTHQRYATSGHSEEYIHPFEIGDFILIHNGVLSGFEQKGNSDTYMFCQKLLEEFESVIEHKKDREEALVYAIKELLDDTYGSYSIFIYDKITNDTYYFKNGTTSIYAYGWDNFVFFTTERDNEDFMHLLESENDWNIYSISPYVIYKIYTEENFVGWKEVGKIQKYSDGWDNSYGCCSPYPTYGYKRGTISDNDKVEVVDYEYGDDPEMCVGCGQPTNLMDIDSQSFMCGQCLDDEYGEFGYRTEKISNLSPSRFNEKGHIIPIRPMSFDDSDIEVLEEDDDEEFDDALSRCAVAVSDGEMLLNYSDNKEEEQ